MILYFKATLRFLKKIDAAIAISAASLFVAGLSAYYTYSIFALERINKAALLEPNLRWEISMEDLTLYLTNKGLGPARISHITLGNSTFCANSTDPEFQKTQSSFLHSVSDDFYDRLVLLHRQEKIYLDAKMRSSVKEIDQGYIIASNTSHPLLKISFKNSDNVQSESKSTTRNAPLLQNKSPAYDSQIAMDNFYNSIMNSFLQVHYCSITGDYCSDSGINLNIANCDLSR